MSQPESASLWNVSLLAFMLSEILILCGVLYADIMFHYLRLGARPHQRSACHLPLSAGTQVFFVLL